MLARDMQSSKKASVQQRRQAYRAACLTWHPDKNPKHPQFASDIFKFLQSLKAWESSGGHEMCL